MSLSIAFITFFCITGSKELNIDFFTHPEVLCKFFKAFHPALISPPGVGSIAAKNRIPVNSEVLSFVDNLGIGSSFPTNYFST